MRDCVFLLPCKNTEGAFLGLLEREHFHRTLGTGLFQFDAKQDLLVAGGADPGVYTYGHEILRGYTQSHAHAVIVLDAEWDGSPGAAKIITDLSARMEGSGWDNGRFCVIVIEPELESWIWQDNPHVEQAFGHERPPSLRQALIEEDRWPVAVNKPPRPKEAAEWVTRRNNVKRSSSIYQQITSQVSVKHCQDPAFCSLVEVLRMWFPPEAGA